MKRLICGVIMLVAAGSVQAVEYNRLQADKSSISFVYQQMGVKIEGRFKKFSAAFNFDPAKLPASKVVVDVDLPTIDAGSDEADSEVASKTWLNTKVYTAGHFESSTVKLLAANRYEVAGKLTIKGKSQDVVLMTTLTTQGSAGIFDGAFVIRRADFAIGEGAWAKFDVVANDVVVKFHMTAMSG